MIVLVKAKDKNFILSLRDYLQLEGIESEIREEDNQSYFLVLVNDSDLKKALVLLDKLNKDDASRDHLVNSAWTAQNSENGKVYRVDLTLSPQILLSYPITCAVFLLCLLIGLAQVFTEKTFDLLSFNLPLIKESHEYWRLITPVFMHGGFIHLATNLVMFVFFARMIEKFIGFNKLLLIVIASAILGNIAQYWANDFQGNFYGLSGVVNATIAYGFIISKKCNRIHIPSGIFAITLIFVPINLIFNMGIANACHIVGIVIGMIIGFWDYIFYSNNSDE